MPMNDPKPQTFVPGTRLRHYKGGLYTVVGSCLSVLVADHFLAIILFQIVFRS